MRQGIRKFRKKEITIFILSLFLLVSGFWNFNVTSNTVVPQIAEMSSIEKTVDSAADNIYMTTDHLNVRVKPGTENRSLGVLDPETSLTITNIKDGWGYVKEFKGYVSMDFLRHISLDNVVGLACTRNDMNPYISKFPTEDSEKVMIEGYKSYIVQPYLYNGLFYKTINGEYINKNLVVVDFFDLEYFKKSYHTIVQPATSRSGYNIKRFTKAYESGVKSISGLSVDDIEYLTKGTGLSGIAQEVYNIEQEFHINSLFTLAVAKLESADGTHYLSRNRNNIFNLNAIDSNPDKAFGYDTKSDCVRDFGETIDQLYFKKGRTDLYSINQIYASDRQWAGKVQSIMNHYQARLSNR